MKRLNTTAQNLQELDWLPLTADQNEKGLTSFQSYLLRVHQDGGGWQSFYGFILNEQDSKDTGVHWKD